MPRVLIISSRDLTPLLGGTILWSPEVERLAGRRDPGYWTIRTRVRT